MCDVVVDAAFAAGTNPFLSHHMYQRVLLVVTAFVSSFAFALVVLATAMAMTVDRITQELTDVTQLLQARSSMQVLEGANNALAQNVTHTLKANITSLQSLGAGDALRISQAIENSAFETVFKTDLHAAIAARLSRQPVPTLAAPTSKQTRILATPYNYLCASDWAVIRDPLSTPHARRMVCIGRCVNIGIESCHEQTVKAVFAMLHAEYQKQHGSIPSRTHTYADVQAWKASFAANVRPVPWTRVIKSFPEFPRDLPSEIFAYAYRDEKPVSDKAVFFDTIVADIKVRKSAKELRASAPTTLSTARSNDTVTLGMLSELMRGVQQQANAQQPLPCLRFVNPGDAANGRLVRSPSGDTLDSASDALSASDHATRRMALQGADRQLARHERPESQELRSATGTPQPVPQNRLALTFAPPARGRYAAFAERLGDEEVRKDTAIADAIADATADAIADAPAGASADAPAATKPRITTEEYEATTLAALVSRNIKRKPATAVAASAKTATVAKKAKVVPSATPAAFAKKAKVVPSAKPAAIAKKAKVAAFSGYKLTWQPGNEKTTEHKFKSIHYCAARLAARKAGCDDATQRSAGQKAHAAAKALYKSKCK